MTQGRKKWQGFKLYETIQTFPKIKSLEGRKEGVAERQKFVKQFKK